MRTRTSATVFGVASLAQTLPAVGLTLIILFAAIRPEASAGLSLPGRLGFWTVHVAIGLAGLWVASLAIRRRVFVRMPLSLAIVLTGLIGALAAAPVFWVADAWLPVPAGEIPDDWLDEFAAGGTWQGIFAEWLEVAPLFVTSWFAVNLPLILAQPEGRSPPKDRPPDPVPEAVTPLRPSGPPGPEPTRARAGPASFLDRLPAVIGRDIVAVSSDLHYLHVDTTRGRAMILGSLKDAAAALGDRGMLVHRAHWVAHAHVRRVQIAGPEAWCHLSTGQRVPVSRRRRRAVRDHYGEGAVELTPSGRRAG